MTAILSSFLILSCIIYLLLFIFFKRINNTKRFLIAFVVFLLMSASFTALLILNGDPASPGSTEITFDDIEGNTTKSSISH